MRSKPTKSISLIKTNEPVKNIYVRIRNIIEKARANLVRAEYGKAILKKLSSKLTADLGKGFDESNLRNIRYFYLSYPKCDALRHELSWTHYRILMRVEKPEARSFYEIECIKNNWSARELERQKGSLLFERLALSKDKKAIMRLPRLLHSQETWQRWISHPPKPPCARVSTELC